MNDEKIGMYSANEIYNELANGFLHRSMVDAMYFEIKDLQKQIADIKFLIEQSDIKDMLWGKEILKIIGDENE